MPQKALLLRQKRHDKKQKKYKSCYNVNRTHLSDEQMDLIYAHYGMGMTPEEIAAELPPNKDGSPETHQAVSIRLNCIFEKVKKYMAQE